MASKLDDDKAALAAIGASARKKFPRNRGRLEQLDSALATATMALEHLEDEEVRHTDFGERVKAGLLSSDKATRDAAGLAAEQFYNLHPEYGEAK